MELLHILNMQGGMDMHEVVRIQSDAIHCQVVGPGNHWHSQARLSQGEESLNYKTRQSPNCS